MRLAKQGIRCLTQPGGLLPLPASPEDRPQRSATTSRRRSSHSGSLAPWPSAPTSTAPDDSHWAIVRRDSTDSGHAVCCMSCLRTVMNLNIQCPFNCYISQLIRIYFIIGLRTKIASADILKQHENKYTCNRYTGRKLTIRD